MNSREEKAITNFKSGFNCAQSVLTSYSDYLGFDKDLAMNISCGFGGGMGRLQKTCGAVTGSYMVLGIYNSKKFSENRNRKEHSYAMVQKFDNKFMEIHSTTECKSLINCDLRTEAGNKFAKENNVFETLCEKYVSDSIKIVNELIEK